MGKIIKDSSGKVLLAGSGAFEVTAAVDSNIVAGNIKKDVEILGVTGTYEGNGGSSNAGPELTFYTCSSNSGTRGGSHGGGGTPEPEAGTTVTFYCSYPSNGRVPVALILYDVNNNFAFDNQYNSSGSGTAIISTNRSVADGYTVWIFSLNSITETRATLEASSGYPGATFDPTTLQAAPIYAINYAE